MCGIVGYSGTSNGIVPVIEGLSRLEYRGYDSAGISIQENGKLRIIKKEGKLDNLKSELSRLKLSSSIAIGHTRWATHGKVNDVNAHPHGNEAFSIVHNGIVENANELRESLRLLGYDFKSETDTETYLNQLTEEFKKCDDVEKSITNAFAKVRGNSAFVIMHKDTHKLYSIKRGAPLVCGLDEESGDVYYSSDPYALVGFTTKIYFPEDNILCVGDAHNPVLKFGFKELDGTESKRFKVQKQEVNLETTSKGDFEHFMLKEIYEQPELIKKINSIYSSGKSLELLKDAANTKPSFVHLSACGTALHAGLVIKNYFEKKNEIRVQADYASEFRYRSPMLRQGELGLFISQSGETADTLACQELCKKSELETFSIVNVEGSTLFRNCDRNLLIHAGIEIGVASTKAFTQQVLAGYLLSNAYSNTLDRAQIEIDALSTGVKRILDQVEEIKNIAKEIYQAKGFLFTGRGDQYPIALEGALKLKEIAYVHAEGYAAGELKHGPISLVDEEMVNIAIVTPDLYEKTLSNAEEVKARRGIMVLIGEKGNKELIEMSDHYFGIDFSGVSETQPVLTNIVLQLLSYYIAKLKGTDIDKPRNLAKSVTVE